MAQTNKDLDVKAYRGDAKTLLAFDLPKGKTANLAGFTIKCKPGNTPAYYLLNKLQFKDPSQHAQVANEPANSSINAPLQKFRWLHVPGSFHQDDEVFYGSYEYTVTPRYLEGGKMQPLDASLSVSVKVDVGPFEKNGVELGFTRGFVQSQAFVNHFGSNPQFLPKGELIFDTSAKAGTDNHGNDYTFADEYKWSGYTARQKVFDIVDEVVADGSLSLDVFAYDLNEPDVLNSFLALAEVGRIRIILDNATLHHNTSSPKPEDQFETLFNKAAKDGAAMKRGKYGRFAHDKILIVYKDGKAVKVLTGSTNFSVTGLYINSNHVLVFNDADTAQLYADVFQESWDDGVSKKFNGSKYANVLHPLNIAKTGKINVTFSPHKDTFAASNLQAMADRISKEKSSVMFAVMAINNGGGPVLPALEKVHASANVFSYGISDSPGGIFLYKPGKKNGILVSGKAAQAKLPPPFDKEDSIGSSHQIHHKFVVCGFNTKDAVVWCGSSNLAGGGEAENGDNLLAIFDQDIATAFAIEAVALVDHFHFRNAAGGKDQSKSAASAEINLNTNNKWTLPYYDPKDTHCADRLLFR